MAGRAQQKKHKRSGLPVYGDELAAARQQQQEVWLLQSQMAERLLAGLAEEDVFEAQALLASVHQNRHQAEAEAEQLAALAERHLQHKSRHRSGLISLGTGGAGAGGKKSKDKINKKEEEKMKRQVMAGRKSGGEEREEQEKRTRQLEALRKWQLKSGTIVRHDV